MKLTFGHGDTVARGAMLDAIKDRAEQLYMSQNL